MANELRLAAVTVSPSGVRGVWLRHDLERLLREPPARVALDWFAQSGVVVRFTSVFLSTAHGSALPHPTLPLIEGRKPR